jgi:glycosyltransferase involved in cell wall biosynthesis
MKHFSLLMSVYINEQANHLTACFDSIYKQTVPPTEIILVEDGPLTSALYEAISKEEERFPQLKRIKLDTNQGLGIALNKGLPKCSYDIIARMDTDDICVPNRFETQLSYLQNHPEIDVIGAWVFEFEESTSKVLGIRSLPEQHKQIYRFGKKRNPMNHPTVMFRKESVLKAGNYLPCPLFEDYYLWGRMLMKGFRFYNIQQPLLYFRRSPEMIKRRGGLSYAKKEISFLKKLHETGYISKWNLIRNISQRYIVRILPDYIRSLIYKYLLRLSPNKYQ